MNLSCYIGYIQSQEKSNSASLRMLLRLWSSAKPASYNVKGLKRVLAAEGLHHMWLWISLMTQKENTSNHFIESQSQTLPNRKVSTSTPSPWSSYLYTSYSNNSSDYPSSSSSSYSSTTSSSGSSSDSSHYNTYSCPTTP